MLLDKHINIMSSKDDYDKDILNIIIRNLFEKETEVCS